MAKLFAVESTSVTSDTQERYIEQAVDSTVQLEMMHICNESISMANSQLDVVTAIQSKLTDDSGSMYVGMEYYAPLIENIAKNFGVRSNLPSLEAYNDKYSSTVAKEIALESIGGFFKAIWDRLVGFVKALFNAFKGLIMGFKNTEAKKLQNMEKILEETEKLVASNATLSSTDKIISTLPSLLTAVGISDFSVSDLIMQSGIRIPSFISTVSVINKADGTVNEELKTSMSNIANKLADDCKTASDLHGVVSVFKKDDTLPFEQLTKINEVSVKHKESNYTFSAVSINYFPETQLSVVGEQQLPPLLLANVKSATNYKSSIIKKLTVPDSLENLEVYVAEITTDSEVLKTFKRVYMWSIENTAAPSSMEPIGSPDELNKLVRLVTGLAKNSLTIDAKRITDTFTKLLDNISSSSVKLSSTYSDISLIISKLKKEVDITAAVSASDGGSDFTESSLAFKSLADKVAGTEKHSSAVRNTILTASKELTDISSFIVKTKNHALDAYIKYFMTNIQQFS